MPSPPLHDPVAVFAALAPTLFNDNDGERFEIHVVCTGDEENLTGSNRGDNVGQCGRTIAKLVKKGNTGVRVPRTLDVASFWHLIELGLVSAENSKAKQSRA
jgi:uridine nucleosidase